MGGSGGACGWSWRYALLRYDVKAAAATPLLGGAWCMAMVLVSDRKVYQMAQFMQVSLDNPEIAMENNDINLQNSTIPEILQTTSAALTVALRPTLEVELLFLVAGKTPMLKMESAGEYPCSVVVAASEGEERRRRSLVLFLCRFVVRLVHRRKPPRTVARRRSFGAHRCCVAAVATLLLLYSGNKGGRKFIDGRETNCCHHRHSSLPTLASSCLLLPDSGSPSHPPYSDLFSLPPMVEPPLDHPPPSVGRSNDG
nr:hypothetical protein Iba_chr03cCG6320 [Ipomoea batatas]